MATYSDIIKGLKVFLEVEGDKHGVCAAHDIIYAGYGDTEKLTSRQLAILEEAGWFIDVDTGSWARWV